ncbi:galactose-3-O-sulfotransferase 2-like, partial [Patella vulgata]|uniref:galactose-3-O-sulfotransferase 2-like n=1 Tax=Patella vulgata TaxID=6465 RepID=UPI0024A80C1E
NKNLSLEQHLKYRQDLSLLDVPGDVHIFGNRKEIHHVGYLKVHKTASTTMFNVFSRFALSRNLTVALPLRTNYLSSSRSPRSWQIQPPPFNETFDMVFHHCFFNDMVFKSLLPDSSVFIASVRDPVSRFISAFNYFRNVYKRSYLKHINSENRRVHPIHEYLRNPGLYDTRMTSPTRNGMVRDFGFPRKYLQNQTLFERFLGKLDTFFDLVLVVEYFNESLVLMKRLLNWHIKDILYTPLVSGDSRHDVKLTEDEIQTYKQFSNLDVTLYEFFLKKFKLTLLKQDETFFQELNYFKKLLDNVKSYCNSGTEEIFHVQKSKWDQEFVLNLSDCKYMKTGELELTKIMKSNQQKLISVAGSNKQFSLNNLGSSGSAFNP